ncbi:cation:proton antiporter domain-containing protein [Polymorphobacter sp.]|uniref:cation:proton antiporter domain-containing protein n=1 Tax=Polymorphobacter sp. TaxID=1909290 RepID=UPI003F726FE6
MAIALPLESVDFRDMAVVIGAAGLVIPAFAALRISPVIGFILVGILVGPYGIGAVTDTLPLLAPLTISNAEALFPLAEMGVALLLFALGLELSAERVRTMRHIVFKLGPVQLIGCAVAAAALLAPFGLSIGALIALALTLSLSSTAVGLQLLSSSGKLGTQAGRTAFGILLFQDIAIAPILLGFAATATEGGFFASLAVSALALGVIILGSRLLLPPLLLQAARTRRPELFLAAALVILIASGAIAHAAGLSPAIGTLTAGIMLAETEYRRQIEATIMPFQGLLLGVFLIWVGMRLDLPGVAREPLLVIGGVVAICTLKGGLIYAMMRRTGRSRGVASHVGLLLAGPSETSLILFGAATGVGLIAGAVADYALLVIGFSLALVPLLGLLGQHIESRLGTDRSADETALEDSIAAVPEGGTIIIGYGRVGRLVGAMLEAHGKPYLAVDSDPDTVIRLKRAGKPVVYGDCRRPDLLEALGIGSASAVVLTIDAVQTLDVLVRDIRERHPNLCVVARARDADHASSLYRSGATDAVPETVESSLQLAEAVLVDLGVPMGPVIASIHEKRAELRAGIQRSPDMVRRPGFRARRGR